MITNWAAATAKAAERARSSGALAPIETRTETVCDGGITFIVRVIRNLERKPPGSNSQTGDPFVPPYEPALLVGDVPPVHVGLLNKFPVLDPHLLVVTRDNEPQTRLLGEADCQALLHVLRGWDGLAFYNGGVEAGASQPHKHIQMVDLPLAATGPALPVAEALAADIPTRGIGHSPRLPFPHAAMRLPADWWRDPPAGASRLRQSYRALLAAVGLPAAGTNQAGPYNLLTTREWLWVVPRQRSSCDGIGINALGFAGALLVPDERRRARLETLGPATCLHTVCR